MFNTPWYDKALIRSDDGFSLRWGQDWATYEENGRKLTLTIDVGGSGATVFLDTISRWDDNPSEVVDALTQRRIAGNVMSALTWKGFSAEVMAAGPGPDDRSQPR